MILKSPPQQPWRAEPPQEVSVQGYRLLRQLFGALSQDDRSPLSRISVANSSFSLDPFRGCPIDCAYCTAASSIRELEVEPHAPNQVFRFRSSPERLFEGRVLAEALLEHPAFIPDKSVISIGTASTEPFLPIVEQETWAIMQTVLDHRLKNPFWIITKTGLGDAHAATWRSRAIELRQQGIPLVISVSHAGAPAWVEPFQGDRFRNLEQLKEAGVRISHHLRPVIIGVNDAVANMTAAVQVGIGLAENICVGGLRRDLGVEIAWTVIHKHDPALLPRDRFKLLPEGYLARLADYLRRIGLTIPVFTRSSEAIAHLLGVPDYNLYRFRPSEDRFVLEVPEPLQRRAEARYGLTFAAILRQIAREIGLSGVDAVRTGDRFTLESDLSYAEERTLIHAIGRSGILSEGDTDDA